MKYVILGSGPAGIFAVEAIRRRDPASPITLVTEEKAVAHSPVMLTYWIGGEVPRQGLFFRDASWPEKMKLDLHAGGRAVALSTQRKKVILEGGEEIPYDRLLIATGSSPLSLPLSGVDLQGVYAIRRIDDAQTIQERILSGPQVLIIGGGFIGLKLACHLKQRGIIPTILEKEARLAPRMLDQKASRFIIDLLGRQGIKVETGVDIGEFFGQNGHAAGVRLKDGGTFPGQMIIQCVGVRPNVQFLSTSGVESEEGILVNTAMETSLPGVYAAGDVTLTWDSITQQRVNNATWPAASRQGIVAGTNMAGGNLSYEHNFPMNASHLFGVPVLVAGDCGEETGGSSGVEEGSDSYRKLLFREGRLAGFIFIGEVAGAGSFLALMKKKEIVSPQDLISKSFFRRKCLPQGLGFRHGSLFSGPLG